MDGKISNPFVISRGVRQGHGLSAPLFNLGKSYVVKHNCVFSDYNGPL